MTNALTGVGVVTGASGGIGRAVACALAAEGMKVVLSGRDRERLQDVATEIGRGPSDVLGHPADIATDEGIRSLVERVETDAGRLDVLVHAAGEIILGDVESARWTDFDDQYRVNLRAPFLLTKALLPMLKRARGQIVFVNSTAGLSAGIDNGIYGACKRALHSLAGSIRDYVNPFGVRVVSVFPGRTATAMQEAVHRFEQRPYVAGDLLQAKDVADLVVSALTLPDSAEITDLTVRPMQKIVAIKRCQT